MLTATENAESRAEKLAIILGEISTCHFFMGRMIRHFFKGHPVIRSLVSYTLRIIPLLYSVLYPLEYLLYRVPQNMVGVLTL